jgi:hypothetical protein
VTNIKYEHRNEKYDGTPAGEIRRKNERQCKSQPRRLVGYNGHLPRRKSLARMDGRKNGSHSS